MQELSHAVTAQKMASEEPYHADFKENVFGKAPKDLAKAYPEYDHHKVVGINASQVCLSIY